MRAAAAMLADARSVPRLLDVLRAAGVACDSAPLDDAVRDALTLGELRDVQLAGGTGMVRVLVVQMAGDVSLREHLRRLARSLATRAPHVLWLVAAVDGRGATAAIAGWSQKDAGRLAAFVWEPDHVVDSDAETLCALAALGAEGDVLLHSRYLEVIGRDALTRRFYRALRVHVDALAASLKGPVSAVDAREVALLYTSRLLFLSFLEAKGWLDGERRFVSQRFDACMQTGGGFHRRVLLPLFFGTLNTPPARRAPAARALGALPFLNGGLFTRTAAERRVGPARFPDDRFGALLDELFLRFRFVAREDSASWSEASVDPEMLGRAFESLMAEGERRAGGVYYTPHEIVKRVADEALSRTATTLVQARDVRVLDPACGSGAFLVYALERLADVRREHGDAQPLATIRRDVLARSIFGVDRSPTAVWLCELRLWLSVVIESDETDPRHIPPLPNLDRHIRVGDALAGPAFSTDAVLVAGGSRIRELRRRYLRATGAKKETLARLLDREERGRVLAHTDRAIETARHARAELLASLRERDLFGQRGRRTTEVGRELRRLRDEARRLRAEHRRVADGGALPFCFGASFADIQSAGGFDIVLGNPPWVRVHRIPAALRARFKQLYTVYRHAHWLSGAAGANATPGFASQVDMAGLFVERSLGLLRHGGCMSLLLPAKLWRSLSGGGVRRLLLEHATMIRLEDWSEARHAFDAAVYPSLVVARRQEPVAPFGTAIVVHGRRASTEWHASAAASIALDASPGAPWLVLDRRARAAFDRVRAAGPPLSACFGAPRLGVKCGCNAAFLVRVLDVADGIASVVDANGETGAIEASMLRPALRGDAISCWDRVACDEWIVWTHGADGAPLHRLPPRAGSWLRRRYGELAHRSDARGSRRWWSLFRTDAADPARPRVVWADFGKRPRALVLPAGDAAVPLNTCYVLPCADERDAWALATLLNSTLAAAWLNPIAEPARGGYRRYLGWTVSLMPVARNWTRARDTLAAAARRPDDFLLDAVLRAYGLAPSDVAPLLEEPPA